MASPKVGLPAHWIGLRNKTAQVRAKDFTEGGAFWQVGVPEVSPRASVTAARAAMDEGLRAQRPGI